MALQGREGRTRRGERSERRGNGDWSLYGILEGIYSTSGAYLPRYLDDGTTGLQAKMEPKFAAGDWRICV